MTVFKNRMAKMVGKKTQLKIVYAVLIVTTLVIIKLMIKTAEEEDLSKHLHLSVARELHQNFPSVNKISVKRYNDRAKMGTANVVHYKSASIHHPYCASLPTEIKVFSTYPINGTGVTVNVSHDFDPNVFQDFCYRDANNNSNNNNITAVLPVYSAPGNFRRRAAIRDTVGRNCEKLNCKIFFIVAVSCNKTKYMKVRDEYYDKRDILMINKIDTYRDLGNKAVAMLNFLINFCSHVPYVIHIVDDTYPNIQLFLDDLRSINDSKLILGHTLDRFRAHRHPLAKGYVSKEEYPHTFFPLYVMGLAYAFLNKDSADLLDKAYTAPYIWIEDVWLTGLVRIEAGFRTERPSQNHKSGDRAANIMFLWRKASCVHQISVEGYYAIYNSTERYK